MDLVVGGGGIAAGVAVDDCDGRLEGIDAEREGRTACAARMIWRELRHVIDIIVDY